MKLDDSIKLVTDTIWQIKKKEDLQFSLEDLLTPKEIVDLWDRIALLKMLKIWIPQRKIANDLSISITTVSRWSRLLKFTQKIIEKYL